MLSFRKAGRSLAQFGGAVALGAVVLGSPGAGSAADGFPAPLTDVGQRNDAPDLAFRDPKLGEPTKISDLLSGGGPTPISGGGFTQLGYTNRSTGVFNTRPDEANVGQNYFFFYCPMDGNPDIAGFDVGFRGAGVYGTNGQNLQAFGEPGVEDHWDSDFDHGAYGWAISQTVVEAQDQDTYLRFGKSYSNAGYESPVASENFFYSRGFDMNSNQIRLPDGRLINRNNRPFTQSGGMIRQTHLDGDIVWNAGWSAGWDTGFERFGNQDVNPVTGEITIDESKGSNFLGGIRLLLWEDGVFSYDFNVGDFGEQGEGYQHTIIFNTVVLSDPIGNGKCGDVVYNVTHNYLDCNTRDGSSSTISNYLYWSLCPAIKIGGRHENWNQSGHVMNMTAVGANVFSSANFTVRPECRWQWAENDGDKQYFQDQFGIPGDSDGKAIAGVDGILTY